METETVKATGVVTVEAACGKTGTKVHTSATFKNTAFVTQTTNETLAALEHSFTVYVDDNNAKCGVDGTETAKCDHGCGATDSRTKAGTALTHSFTNYISDGNATCTADGTKTAACDHGCGEKDTVADTGSMLEHVWDAGEVEVKAGCEDEGVMRYTCTTCPEGQEATKTEKIPATGHRWAYTEGEDPTCTTPGEAATAICTRCYKEQECGR